MVDEHGTPCGSLRKDFERDVRLLTKDLDPGPCFKDQEEAMQERYFNRLFEGKFLKVTRYEIQFSSFYVLVCFSAYSITCGIPKKPVLHVLYICDWCMYMTYS